MHMLEPKELEQRRAKRSHDKNAKPRYKRRLVPIIVLLIIYVAVVSIMPLASLKVQTLAVKIPSKPSVSIPWPAYGQAAIGAVGFVFYLKMANLSPCQLRVLPKLLRQLRC